MRNVPAARVAAMLLIGTFANTAWAQYRPYTPPPAVPAVPYTPPTTYEPPRAFEHAQPPPSVVIPPPTIVVPGRGRGRDDPVVVIPPPSGPPPPEARLDPVEEVLLELAECVAHGTTMLVDCLRQNHNSVMIRRLEACLRSETIPADGNDVRQCLAAGGW
jgi:hypothetical protein